jgi:hypothetical protein
MKRPVKLGIASLKALGTILVLGAAAHAGLPYLPLIGPPPLRVQAVKSPRSSVARVEAAPAAVATNAAVTLTASTLPGTTKVAGGDTFVGPLSDANADKSLEDTFSASVFALPTPDLLGLTPQMLATYFHPVQFGTNTALVGPFHVGFMPPLPAPQKSSRAEYIVK